MSDDRLSDADYDRLARYVTGEMSDVERVETSRWIAVDGDRQRAIESMQLGWGSARSPARWNVDEAWRQLSSRLAEAPKPVVAIPSPNEVVPIGARGRVWHFGSRAMQLAASVVIVVGAGLVWPSLRARLSGDSDSPIVASGEVVRISTKPGERRTVDLADGTRIVLGVSSSLVTRPGYGGTQREVDLQGEAFFTVAHDERRPFLVHVGETVIEDLGTEFVVRAYERSGSIRVAVNSGSVAVRRGRSAAPRAVLAPRDVAFLGDTGELRLTRGVDVSTYTAWTRGRLVFDDAPLAQVAQELERWYGVEVRITDSALLSRHLTTAFESESLDEVLRVIGLSLDVRYVRRGNRVEFTGSGASTGAASPASRVETGA